jgi:hypothetical protein
VRIIWPERPAPLPFAFSAGSGGIGQHGGGGVDTTDDARLGESTRPGLGRRDLIKAAAAAGAVAWTAPVIIDSLASPAAATTCPDNCASCVFVEIKASSNCQSAESYNPAGTCQPTGGRPTSCTTCSESDPPGFSNLLDDFCIVARVGADPDAPSDGCSDHQSPIIFDIVTTGDCASTCCKFVSGIGEVVDGSRTCWTGVISNDGRTITFTDDEVKDPQINDQWVAFRLVLCC